MTPEQMLRTLSEQGEEAVSDYDDALDGWFGWQVTGDLLTVTFQPYDGAARDALPVQLASWRLVPVGEPAP